MTRRAMSAADAAWLRMDRPTNHMVITAVLTFDAPLDAARVRRLARDRLVARFPPFRQIVSAGGPLGTPRWEDAADFDVDLHVHRRALAAPGDRRALRELVGDLMSSALDPARPLWELHVVEGYGTGAAVVARVHHCIADGLALARVLLALTDEAGAGAPLEPLSDDEADDDGVLSPVTGPLRAAAGLGRRIGGGLLHESVETLLHPAHLLDLGREVRDDASALVELLTVPEDPETVLKSSHPGVAQRVAWTPPLALPAVKELAHVARTTVNDVLLTAVSGALARYVAAHGERVDELHVTVPFNIRPPGEPLPATLGNRFGLIIVALPLGDEDARERLAAVHERMAAIKASRQPAMSFAVLGAAGAAPGPVEDRLVDFMTAKSTAVVTNVPGPREPVSLAGVPIREVLVWAPCAGSVGMSVSLFSYRDTVSIGFMTHARLVPDPAALVDGAVLELAALRDGLRAELRAHP